MRAIAALCHGRERRHDEPYGWAAPLARCIAWALVAAGAVLFLLGILMFAAEWRGRTVVVRLSGVVVAFGLLCRLVAELLRPGSVDLPRRTP